jgi:hypothetical protein
MTVPAIARALAIVVAVASPALAATEPTLSDIAGCNEQAAARTGASALPARPGIVPGPADRGAGAYPPAPSGRTSDSTQSGTTAEKSDPTGSVITQAPDPLVKGMDAERADDPQYRAAYRDCMRGRVDAR